MELLAAEFNVIPLSEGVEGLRGGALPARAVSITFDDGYADNEKNALPILARLGLTATFFISTGFSEGGVMFNDVVIESVRRAPAGSYDLASHGLGGCELADSASRRAAIDLIIGAIKYRPPGERNRLSDSLAATLGSELPRGLMMDAAQIRRLHGAGMEIGCHTVNHPILARLDEAEANAEIVGAKHELEEMIDGPVTTFAYPNGKAGVDYGPRDVQLVKRAGFRAAVSTMAGVAGRSSDIYQLPRMAPWDENGNRLGLRLLVGCVQSMTTRAASERRPPQIRETRK